MNKDEFAGKLFVTLKKNHGRFTDIILDYAPKEAFINILDIGCGSGSQLFHMAHNFPNAYLTGVDISEDNIDEARSTRDALELGSRVELIAGDYIDFHCPCFDIIVSDSTLQNIDTPTVLLFGKIANDLKPGGVLIASMPYTCVFNHCLWLMRRILRFFRGSITDALLLATAKAMYRGQYDEPTLRQRSHYMYLLPYHYDSPSLRSLLLNQFGLPLEREYTVPWVSVAQPKHRILVCRKSPSLL